MAATPVEVALAPLDWVRSAALRVTAPRFGAYIVDRERRVALIGALAVTAALLGTIAAPMWMLALSPIVWGVPHLLADVRYLVVQPGLHKRWATVVLVAAGLASVLLGLGLRGGALAVAAAAFTAETTWRRRLAGLATAGALYAVASHFGWVADVVFAHAHNLIAVGLFVAWRRRRSGRHWGIVALFVLASGAVLLGAFDQTVAHALTAPTPFRSLDLAYYYSIVAPRVESAFATRLVLFFCFAQSVHYAVWLRFVPDEARPSSTPRSFSQSYRALRKELGALVLGLAVVLTLVFLVWGAHDVRGAREGYFSVSFFHSYLELAAVMLMVLERRTPNGARANATP